MSILQNFPNHGCYPREHLSADDRMKRNPREDIKLGLDLIFELKDKIDKLHPLATEALLQIMNY